MSFDWESDFEDAEESRRLANLIRLGVISAVDPAKARVKVQTEEIITDWLPWVTGRAGTVATWSAPEVGEQVVLLAPSGELAQAVVLPGIYQNKFPAPSTNAKKHIVHYPDGSSVEYDLETQIMTVISAGKVSVTAAEEISLIAPVIKISGSITLTGDGNWSGNITHNGGNLSSQGVVLHTHKHGGVQIGGGQTSGPT